MISIDCGYGIRAFDYLADGTYRRDEKPAAEMWRILTRNAGGALFVVAYFARVAGEAAILPEILVAMDDTAKCNFYFAVQDFAELSKLAETGSNYATTLLLTHLVRNGERRRATIVGLEYCSQRSNLSLHWPGSTESQRGPSRSCTKHSAI